VPAIVNGVPFAFNEAGLFALLDAPLSPVSRYVTVKAEAVAQVARENVRARFTTRTGNLEQSIGVFPTETADGIETEIGTEGATYGRVLELGGDAHYIEAVNRRFLFSEPGNPTPLVNRNMRIVPHPGPVAQPWLEPALRTVFNGG